MSEPVGFQLRPPVAPGTPARSVHQTLASSTSGRRRRGAALAAMSSYNGPATLPHTASSNSNNSSPMRASVAGAAFADVSATTPSISRVADGTTSEPWTPMLQDSQIAWSPSLESPAVQRVRVGAIPTVSDSQPLAGQLQRLEKWRYAVNSDAADSVGGGQPSSSLIDDDTRGPALRQPAKSMDETKVPPNLFGVDTSAQSRDGTIPASTPLSVSARPQRLFQFDSQPSLALGIHLRVKLIKKIPFSRLKTPSTTRGKLEPTRRRLMQRTRSKSRHPWFRRHSCQQQSQRCWPRPSTTRLKCRLSRGRLTSSRLNSLLPHRPPPPARILPHL